jgi:hypothetical protein
MVRKIFVVCDRIKMSFPGFPVPLRLPFSAWWLIRGGALDHDLLAGRLKLRSCASRCHVTKTRTVTIDHLADQFGPTTHIKVNVEGYEAAVVRGVKSTLIRLASLLFLELHNEMIRSEGGDPNCVLDDLGEMRYEMFSIDGVKTERTAIL